MTWMACSCGWVGVSYGEVEVEEMHQHCDEILSTLRRINANAVNEKEVESILGEVRWQ